MTPKMIRYPSIDLTDRGPRVLSRHLSLPRVHVRVLYSSYLIDHLQSSAAVVQPCKALEGFCPSMSPHLMKHTLRADAHTYRSICTLHHAATASSVTSHALAACVRGFLGAWHDATPPLSYTSHTCTPTYRRAVQSCVHLLARQLHVRDGPMEMIRYLTQAMTNIAPIYQYMLP